MVSKSWLKIMNISSTMQKSWVRVMILFPCIQIRLEVQRKLQRIITQKSQSLSLLFSMVDRSIVFWMTVFLTSSIWQPGCLAGLYKYLSRVRIRRSQREISKRGRFSSSFFFFFSARKSPSVQLSSSSPSPSSSSSSSCCSAICSFQLLSFCYCC